MSKAICDFCSYLSVVWRYPARSFAAYVVANIGVESAGEWRYYRQGRMTNCEKAIEILQRTHDGDDLAPQHLKLVELAVNDMVTEVGQAAFEQLYTQIAGNTYVQPWYHDIENLRKDHRGYVYWKEIQVDHYSFDQYEDAHEAALELADPCRTLEMLGIPV